MTYTIRPSDSSWRRPGLSSQGAVCFLGEGGRTPEHATTPAQRLSLFSERERALREVPPLRVSAVRPPDHPGVSACSPPAPPSAGFRASSPISSGSSQPRFSPCRSCSPLPRCTPPSWPRPYLFEITCEHPRAPCSAHAGLPARHKPGLLSGSALRLRCISFATKR